ncbi:MAG TPA: DUF3592 domain-containing protein [Armatimonadota bacterium]|nr:DUF3592 domain-containing protein [Armatimonadota bacterium]
MTQTSATRQRFAPASAPAPTLSDGNTGNGVRRVRWRRAQRRAILLGALICVLCFAIIALFDLVKGRQTIRQQSQSVRTIARITRHWTTAGAGVTHYWVAYRYQQLPAGAPDPTMEITNHLLWAAMSPGQSLAINYTPADPTVNHLQGNKSHLFQRWLWTGGLLSLFAALIPLGVYLSGWRRKRSQFWLAQHGRPGIAEIVDASETMVPRGRGACWHYDVEYAFAGPDGERIFGRHKDVRSERRTWDIGSVVTVFFDPANPARHALYADLPAEVMSLDS